MFVHEPPEIVRKHADIVAALAGIDYHLTGHHGEIKRCALVSALICRETGKNPMPQSELARMTRMDIDVYLHELGHIAMFPEHIWECVASGKISFNYNRQDRSFVRRLPMSDIVDGLCELQSTAEQERHEIGATALAVRASRFLFDSDPAPQFFQPNNLFKKVAPARKVRSILKDRKALRDEWQHLEEKLQSAIDDLPKIQAPSAPEAHHGTAAAQERRKPTPQGSRATSRRR